MFVKQQIDNLLSGTITTDSTYTLWSRPIVEIKESKSDSLKRVSWHKRFTVEIKTGRFLMLKNVQTDIDDKTYMDISDATSMIGIQLTRWMDDSMAWFMDVARLKIPQKQEINGARIEAGGGVIVPITVGFKYAFHHHKLRPYIIFGTGPIPIFVFGGKFSLYTDPSRIQNKIKSEMRLAFHTTIGCGLTGRLGKRLFLNGDIRYIHSSEFESVGLVNAIRGFNANASAGFIFGANRLRP